jgi:iron transport multicopper oxidase
MGYTLKIKKLTVLRRRCSEVWVLLQTKHNTSANHAAHAMLDNTMFDNILGYLDPNVTAYVVYNDQKPLPPPLVVSRFDIVDDFTLTPYDKLQLFDGTSNKTIVLNLNFFELDGQNR